MKGKKARTREAIRETIQQHLGEVKIRLPNRRKEKGQPDFTSVEISALNARADEWLARHGLPAANADREPEHVMRTAPHRARIVQTMRRGELEEKRGRGISVILSHETHRVLGEQG